MASANITLQDAILEVSLSQWSETHLNAFIRSLDTQEPASVTFFTYLTKYVEYNRGRYQMLKQELFNIRSEFTALKREVANALNTTDVSLCQAAPQAPGTTSTPYVAAAPAPGAGLPSYIAAPQASEIRHSGTIQRNGTKE